VLNIEYHRARKYASWEYLMNILRTYFSVIFDAFCIFCYKEKICLESKIAHIFHKINITVYKLTSDNINKNHLFFYLLFSWINSNCLNSKWFKPRNISSSFSVIVRVRIGLQLKLLLVTDVSTTWSSELREKIVEMSNLTRRMISAQVVETSVTNNSFCRTTLAQTITLCLISLCIFFFFLHLLITWTCRRKRKASAGLSHFLSWYQESHEFQTV